MLADILNMINDPMATIPVVLLSATGLYFTIEMFRRLSHHSQRKAGLDPVYDASTCPEIADETEGWKRE